MDLSLPLPMRGEADMPYAAYKAYGVITFIINFKRCLPSSLLGRAGGRFSYIFPTHYETSFFFISFINPPFIFFF